jgi:putative ABC transport system permease protein
MTTHGEKGPRIDPPRLAERLLERIVPPGPVGRSMLGDAREEHAALARSGATTRAFFRYWGLVLSIGWHFLGRRLPRGSHAVFDLRLAARGLARRPLFALASVVTLALGIGATTTVFSIAHGILFEPLPYPDSERLVGVFREDPDVTGLNPTAANVSGLLAVPYRLFEDWRTLSPVFETTGAFSPYRFTVTSGEEPERVLGAVASSGVFAALGTPAQIGRTLLPEDDEVGAPQVAVLGHGYWQRAFGGDTNVLGSTVSLNGTPVVVVGVMPQGFSLPGRSTDLWVNFDDDSKLRQVRESGWLQVIALLKEGVSFQQAEVEMDALALRIIEEHPVEAGKGVVLFPFRDLVVSRASASIWILVAAVGTVLLIACANIAGLLLVRATDRRRELAVRLALGSGRGRLVGQSLAETGLIAGVGGLLGYAGAALAIGPFVEAFPGGLPRAAELAIDYRVLLITAGLTGATSLLMGVLPAYLGARTDVNDALRGSGRGVAGGRRQRSIQALLVTSEVTLAVFLLVVAGLFLRSFTGMRAVDPGFDPDGILTTTLVLPSQYRDPPELADARDPPELADAFFRDLTGRLKTLPGVTSVAGVTQMPYAGGYSAPPVRAEADEGFVDGTAHISHATPGYFAALGIPLSRGRAFSPDDTPDTEPVTVINEAMARRYWQDHDPIGRRLKINSAADSVWFRVVGVVKGIRYDLDLPPQPEFYLALGQLSYYWRTMVVKATGDPGVLASEIRQAVWDIDPKLPVSVSSLASRLENSPGLVGARFASILLGGLAGIAALLAILGVYAVLAYTVAQRTQEIGIQMALGAASALVLGRVLGRGLRLGLAGIVLGLALALAAGRFLESLVFEVRPSDPTTLASVAALILTATLLAAWLPARRAVRVDPVEALRME